MAKKILLGLTTLILAFFGVVIVLAATSAPNTFVSRSVVINAPIETVFAQVNNLENWTAWSPWKAMDPGMEVSYGPTRIGEGAWYTWNGKQAGTGKLVITESVANKSIETSIDFGDMGTGSGNWRFSQDGNAITVTWGFTSYGRHLLDKIFHLFLEGMLGPQFESGLIALKAVAESDSSSSGR